ncbi:hypothetical protein NQ318_015085 [Aromia moschata]|uniref:RRM domain-containing protein n=1 Tax=Aromia moschata TaxID=1265417 RepID=A0AAV8YXQ1_9CUCU|nr:hypothetical protein NQ318_015085 [Aromia moschata]
MGVDDTDTSKLYIRLPAKIKEELEIRALHPDIVRVCLPRQKSRRWCIVEFDNEDKRQAAIVALKQLRIDNKPIQIRPFRKERARKRKESKETAVSTRPLLKLLKKSA